MALKGKLRDFGLTQLLNLVHLARKTGALSIESSEGNAEFFFHEGKLIHAAIEKQPSGLADLMVKAGKLTSKEAELLRKSGRVRDDKQLGLLLINAGKVAKNDIVQAIRKHMMSAVEHVFNWQDGAFVFDQKLSPPAGKITIPIGLETIVLEGSRRREEQEDLQSELPSLDVVLKFTDGPGKNLRSINLSVDEWRVISFINPRNTVATIAKYNQMSEFQVRKIVAKLIRDELVEVVGGGPSPRKGAGAVAPQEAAPVSAGQPAKQSIIQSTSQKPRPQFSEPEVEKGIISRLISRIRGL